MSFFWGFRTLFGRKQARKRSKFALVTVEKARFSGDIPIFGEKEAGGTGFGLIGGPDMEVFHPTFGVLLF